MMENGLMIKLTDMENIHTLMEPPTEVIGKKINSTVKAAKPGLMPQAMKETISMEKNREKASLSGEMAPGLKETLKTIILKGLEATTGVMIGYMLASGNATRCMEKEFSLGLMEGNTKEIT